MHRRQFLGGSLGTALVAPWLVDTAEGGIEGQARGQATPAPPAGRPAPPTPRKLTIDAHSRSLQWLRSADEVAEAAIEMVCGGVCPTVLPHPGHIDPAKVAQELPDFVKRVRSHGLTVTQIKGPAILDLTEPNAETIIAT